MKSISKRLILLAVLSLAPVSASGQGQGSPVGMITAVQGGAKIFDGSGKTGRQAELADLIFPGTRIVAGEESGVVFVFCPEQITASLPPDGEVTFGSAAMQVKGPGLRQSHKIPACRIPVASSFGSPRSRLGGVNLRGETTLRLYSPSGTRVLPKGFVMRWSSVAGADLYRLDIRDETGNTVWESDSKATQLVCDSDRLLANMEYRWRVTALQGADILASGSTWLRVASAEDQRRIIELRSQLIGVDREKSTSTPQLLMAFLYEELEMPDLALAEYQQVYPAKPNAWLAEKVKSLRDRLNIEP